MMGWSRKGIGNDLFSGRFASAKVLAVSNFQQESGQMNWCAVRAGLHNPIDRR
jgi:hypothetical protein